MFYYRKMIDEKLGKLKFMIAIISFQEKFVLTKLIVDEIKLKLLKRIILKAIFSQINSAIIFRSFYNSHQKENKLEFERTKIFKSQSLSEFKTLIIKKILSWENLIN